MSPYPAKGSISSWEIERVINCCVWPTFTEVLNSFIRTVYIYWPVVTMNHYGTRFTFYQEFVSLAAKHHRSPVHFLKRVVTFISAMVWCSLTAKGAESVIHTHIFFYFYSHRLESGCLGKVQGNVGMWSPGCTLQIHKAALSSPHPSKWPCQAAISWDWLLQYRGIKAFYEVFSQPKVCATAACVPFSTTRVDLTSLDS